MTKPKYVKVESPYTLSFDKTHNKFKLRVTTVNGSRVHLGYYDTQKEAVKASLMTPVQRAELSILKKLTAGR